MSANYTLNSSQIARLGLGATGTLAFIPAMFLGMWAARLLADGTAAPRLA